MSVWRLDRFAARLFRAHVGRRLRRSCRRCVCRPTRIAAADVVSSAVASPKSRTFTVPSGRTPMLPGFRSRWMMPCSCAASSASAICSRDRQRLGPNGATPRAVRGRRPRPAPSQGGHVVDVLETVEGRDVRMVERREQARLPVEARHAAVDRSLTRARAGLPSAATSRPSRVSRARYTSPMPPAPSSACSSKTTDPAQCLDLPPKPHRGSRRDGTFRESVQRMTQQARNRCLRKGATLTSSSQVHRHLRTCRGQYRGTRLRRRRPERREIPAQFRATVQASLAFEVMRAGNVISGRVSSAAFGRLCTSWALA